MACFCVRLFFVFIVILLSGFSFHTVDAETLKRLQIKAGEQKLSRCHISIYFSEINVPDHSVPGIAVDLDLIFSSERVLEFDLINIDRVENILNVA